ncbi:MAG: hypothetical protein D5S00_08720 [Tindallia sp. MSAO_Bac2]|nr:MAG: hypothetical protein D5S00_08720 [Tindallia sp. MSAO_Bac2]
MKKRLALGITMVLVLAFGMVSFAETVEVPQWYNDMLQWRQERLEEAVDEGLISEEEAEWRQEHWEEMKEFHLERELGVGPGSASGYGLCHREGGLMGGFMRGFSGGMRGSGGPRGGFGGQRGGNWQ